MNDETTTTDLALSAPRSLARPITDAVIGQIMVLGPIMYQSARYKLSSPQDAMLIMLKGHELGFPMTAAPDYIDLLPDGPALNGAGMLALIHRSNLIEMTITDHTDAKGEPTACVVWMKRRDNGFAYTATFTAQDAIRAGLVKSGGAHQKWPADMLCWRAVARCARRAAPDLIGGLHLSFELEEPTEPPPPIPGRVNTTTGEVIADGEFTVEES